MRKVIILKALLLIVSFGVILFAGFIAVIGATLSGAPFFSVLFAATALFLLAVVTAAIFTLVGYKKILISLAIYLVLALVVSGAYQYNKKRVAAIPTISDRGVDLDFYRPYYEDTKAVRLDEASALRLEDDLPLLDGATALYPLYAAFVQAVYPEGDYYLFNSQVKCGGTIDAYNSLINGGADIIFAAKPSDTQQTEAKEKGIELKLMPIGREAFVFFVNSRNPVTALTSEQIRSIYSGKTVNWKEVGGKNDRIRAFQRPEGSGSQTMLQKIMEETKLMTPPQEDIPTGMGDIIHQTADYKNYKNAIGYSFLYYATEMVKNDQVRLISIDGVYPSKETIRDKTYPMVADFYAVTAGSANPNVEKFIAWILSEQGQSLVERTGYTAITD